LGLNNNKKGAFEVFAGAVMDDAIGAIRAKLESELTGKHIRYEPKVKFDPIKYLQYRVKRDFDYFHNDQDVNHGKYSFKRNQIIELRADTDPIYFMPDRTNLELIGTIEK
jgi:hypothetical protein